MRIRHWILLLAAFFALTACACGGGDDKTVDIPGGGEVNVSDDLPDEFPDDFPIYDGADFQGSITGQDGGVESLVATWETGDGFDDVKAFYDEELGGDGPWTADGQFTAEDSAVWNVTNGDGEVGGVAIANADGKTTIIVTVGEDLGDLSTDEEAPDEGGGDGDSGSGSAELPDETELPDDFPSDDVPLPDGIRVTNASSFTSGGVKSFVIEFYSQDSVDGLATHFKDAFESKNWTQSFQTETDGQVYAAYAEKDDGTGTVVTVTIAESGVEGYNTVAMTVTST